MTNISTINTILKNYERVYFAGHGSSNCIWLNNNTPYCYPSTGLQSRLFVVSACKAGGNNFGARLHANGVTCVIGASGVINESTLWDECGNWADIFWDKATGNKDAGYQRSAHNARLEANSATWLNWCDLDSEIGDCLIYI